MSENSLPNLETPVGQEADTNPTDDDPVLVSARELLDGSICECSHLETSHAFALEDSNAADCAGDYEGETCDCLEFRPVAFVVRRASGAPDADD